MRKSEVFCSKHWRSFHVASLPERLENQSSSFPTKSVLNRESGALMIIGTFRRVLKDPTARIRSPSMFRSSHVSDSLAY